MKPTVSWLLSCLLLALSATHLSAEPVLDVDGIEVRAGRDYYVSSVFPPGFSGLWPVVPGQNNSGKYEIEPLFGEIPGLLGKPVNFSSVESSDPVIPVDTDLIIKFAPPFPFPPVPFPVSPVWKVSNKSAAGSSILVTTGGDEQNDESKFMIMKAESAYNIQHCDVIGCKGVGISVEDGKYRLAVNVGEQQHPLKVVFSTRLIRAELVAAN